MESACATAALGRHAGESALLDTADPQSVRVRIKVNVRIRDSIRVRFMVMIVVRVEL